MLDIALQVDEWIAAGRPVALATVIATWGSSPRQPGAKLAISPDANADDEAIPALIGSVSGGCIEAAVVGEALDILAGGAPRVLHFGVSDDTAWDVGLACGGKVSVFVERLDVAWWRIAADYARTDRALTTTIRLADGARMSVDAAGASVYQSETLDDPIAADAETFIDRYTPRPRLIIVGGAHVAWALAAFARVVGYRVVLIDPRRAFATPERFPRVDAISHEYPDKALPKIGLTDDTYMAILTHDPKIDDPALRVALPAKLPYIGILSSRKTHEGRIARLTAAGLDPALLTQIRTPIGVDIDARTPEEIALAIMAEIIGARNRRPMGQGAARA
jgi:xanthine dehydrogenase accessory factor